MSIFHLTNDHDDPNNRQKIYIQACDCSEGMKISETLEVRDLFFDAANGDKIELSSVLDKGTMGSVLKSNGDGTVQWGSDLTGGVNYTGSLPTAVNQLSLYNSTDGTTIKNSSLVEQDLLDTQAKANDNEINISTLQTDKLDKLNDIATNLSVDTILNVTGQLNYASNLMNVLVDVGKWDTFDNTKGLTSNVTGSFNPYVELKFMPPSNPPTTSDEARTIIVYAGSGFLNSVSGVVEEIKSQFVSFNQTELIVPPNYDGLVRVDANGIVSLRLNFEFETARFFTMARVVTNSDSILFIDGKPSSIRNYVNEIFDTRSAKGTYFMDNESILPVTQTPTPLTFNVSSFTYYYNDIEYSAVGKSLLFFYRFHRDATEALAYKQLSAVQTLDNLFDNGSNSLVVVPDGFYKKDLFMFINYTYDTGISSQRKYFIIYSTEIYATLKEAQFARSPPIPSFVPRSAVVLCNFITRVDNAGATVVLEEIQDARKFLTAEIPYSSRDDHSQYLLVDGTRPMTGNLNLNNNSINNCDELKTDNLTSSTTDKILINNDLDFQNIYNLKNISLINNIQPSGGLYSESSGFSTASTTEIDILGQGANSGSLSIPANNFIALSVYSFKASGVLSGGTNDEFRLLAKTQTDIPTTILLGEIQPIIQDNGLVNVPWDIMIDFTIRATGIAGVASLVLSGAFRYNNNNDVVRTFLRTVVLTTDFDTTVANTLQLTFQNDAINPLTNFRIDQAAFSKWF